MAARGPGRPGACGRRQAGPRARTCGHQRARETAIEGRLPVEPSGSQVCYYHKIYRDRLESFLYFLAWKYEQSEMMDKDNINVLILLSGGIDSTAIVHYYLSQKFRVKALFVDYGQISSRMEFKSARNVSRYYSIELIALKFSSQQKFSDGEIQGRNAFLVMAALLSNPTAKGLVAIGIHSGTFYYDCSDLFVKGINGILNGYTNGQLTLDAPFIKWDKRMIFNYCREYSVPINLTYSCENGADIPCGKCRSCLDRSALGVS
jgi:7-cyano-7-deazaguanine synthase